MSHHKSLREILKADVPIIGITPPKVALGYCFGTLHWPFVRSLQALREYDLARMANGGERTTHHHIPQAGLYIDHNRNMVVEKFLATDAEWLLQIDTDIEFQPTIVEQMLAAAGRDRKIVAASVPLGWSNELGIPLPSAALMRTEIPAVWTYVPADHWCPSCGDQRIGLRKAAGGYSCTREAAHVFASDDPRITSQLVVTEDGIPADGLATAVILIHRSVFDDISDMFGQCWFLKRRIPRTNSPKSRAAWKLWLEKYGAIARPDDEFIGDASMRDREFVSVGEDLSFCLRAAEAGHQSYCVKINGLRHHKIVPLAHEDAAEVEEPKLIEVAK